MMPAATAMVAAMATAIVLVVVGLVGLLMMSTTMMTKAASRLPSP